VAGLMVWRTPEFLGKQIQAREIKLATLATLVFNGYELAALIVAALISSMLIADGESTWFEGLQLLGVYVLPGVVFYYA
jgi:calcium/proton exchanger cax